MKIAIVVNELNIRGGTHKQVLRLCEYLKEKGYDFKLYTKYYCAEKTYPQFGNFEIISLKKEATKFQPSKGYLIRKITNNQLIRKEQKELLNLISKDTDIINVHDNGLPWLMYYAKKRKNIKVVWQINDLPFCFRVGCNSEGKEAASYKVRRFLYRRLAKKIDKITVNVTKNKERVKKYLLKDADVFYCGVDVNENLKIHGYPQGKKEFKLLSVGVFFPYRNYETLVNVIEQLNTQNMKIHLDIIGSTELNPYYSNSIQEMVNSRGLADQITIWGQVDEKIYNKLYSEADIFAFVNIDQSWGLAVFEAMSCGLPVIVSNSVGAIELLSDDVNSIIVDPLNVKLICEKIKVLLNDKKYYEKISVNARQAVVAYTWDKLYCEKMVQLFKEL